MTKGARLVRAAMPLLLMQSLVSCSVATQSGSQSITPSGSEMPTPTAPRSTAPSSEPSPTLIPVPPDFTVSWTEMPWTGRVWGLSYDAKLGDWMAMGTEEMRTSPDGATWQRHAFQGENLGPGCPDPQPPRMVDAVRMGDRLFAAGTWDNDCDVHALLMWSSLDGATWQVVPQGARVGSSAHAIATNGSTLTVANTFYAEGTGDVITSTVGSGWTSHVARSPAAILDVYGDADGSLRLDTASRHRSMAP